MISAKCSVMSGPPAFPGAAQNVAQFNAAVALGELFGNTAANRPKAEKSDLEHVFLRSNVLMSLIRESAKASEPMACGSDGISKRAGGRGKLV